MAVARLAEVRRRWLRAFGHKAYARSLVGTLAFVVVTSLAFSSFVPYIEARQGVVLEDPVLRTLPRADLALPISLLIYASVLTGLLVALRRPVQLLQILQLWSGMLILRIVAMYLAPFAPPHDLIQLTDPVAEIVFGQSSAPTRDLFFSGHTSTAMILVLTARDRVLRRAFAALLVLIGTGVLIQRAHYTLDVFAAPFFVYAVYRLTHDHVKRLEAELG